jgi:transposase, IS6 family
VPGRTGARSEYEYAVFRGQTLEVRNIKELFLQVFKILLAERRDDVLASRPDIFSTVPKHAQYELVAPGFFANKAIFPGWQLKYLQDAADELDVADGLLVKFASNESDEVIESFAEPANDAESVPVGLLRWRGRTSGEETDLVITSRSVSSAPAGYRFPREVIAVAVRWYLRYALSYRDVEELLAERGIEVDHVTVYRWVHVFTAEFIDAARPARHATGHRWFFDETYVKVAGRWTYLYRAVDQHGQVIDVLVFERRNAGAARAFFTRALSSGPAPVEVTTDRAPVYPRIIDDLVPAARHVLERYTNNRVESDHGRLKARLRPMRGLKIIRSLRTIAAGHAFVQNLRRGHYALSVDLPARDRVRVAFGELAPYL